MAGIAPNPMGGNSRKIYRSIKGKKLLRVSQKLPPLYINGCQIEDTPLFPSVPYYVTAEGVSGNGISWFPMIQRHASLYDSSPPDLGGFSGLVYIGISGAGFGFAVNRTDRP